MNRAAFYSHLRKRQSGVFGTSLSQAQVNTLEALLDEGNARGIDNPSMAYIMATGYHEGKMVPSRENLYYTTASRIVKVWPSRFNWGSAQEYLRNPRKLANKVYNGRLGNRENSDDGWIYRGGGLDHLTGRDNYRKTTPIVGVDLVAHPERILEPEIAVESLIHGMLTGRYRPGHKLSRYVRPGAVDFVGAREIINADGKANGSLIAGYARAFLAALEVSGRPYSPAPNGTRPGIDSHLPPVRPDVDPIAPKPETGLWAAILRLFGIK